MLDLPKEPQLNIGMSTMRTINTWYRPVWEINFEGQ